MDIWLSAKELATLPGLPNTVQGVIYQAKNNSFKSRRRSGRGGGMEYHFSALPEQAQHHLIAIGEQPSKTCKEPLKPVKKAIEKPFKTKEVAVIKPQEIDLSALKKWQRDIFTARVVIYREFERLVEQHGTSTAVRKMIAMAEFGQLPEHIQRQLQTANARRGASGRSLSKSTLLAWHRTVREQGINGLAPRTVEKNDVPDWAPYFLKCYQRPQKPSVPQAMEAMALILPESIAMPSYSQVMRFQKKRSRIDIERGRHSAQSLKQFKGFTRRSTENLMPLDIGQCDGHSFKARVAHPEHGRPFHPEVCAVIDWKTRVCTGWAAWLSESSLTVSGAIIHSLQWSDEKPYGGVYAILYSDNGAGNTSDLVADEVVGLLARIGTEAQTGRPGNPQGLSLIHI